MTVRGENDEHSIEENDLAKYHSMDVKKKMTGPVPIQAGRFDRVYICLSFLGRHPFDHPSHFSLARFTFSPF
jgi:hypothetical protein